MDLTSTIVPRSDQINADDLLAGPVTVTITDVRKGSAEQPVDVVLDIFGPGRPFKPSKSMRRVMVTAWGPDSHAYIGHRMTLFRDPRVRFGADEVGGIRISHMSHIKGNLTVALTVTRGKRAAYVVEPLPDAPLAAKSPAEQAIEAFAGKGIPVEAMEAHVGTVRAEWTDSDLAALFAWYSEVTPALAAPADTTGEQDQ